MSTVNIGASLPAGSNLIGNIKIVDTAGTNQVAVDANNNLHVAIYNAANSMAIDGSNNAHVGVWNGSNQLAVNSGGNAAINVAQVAGSAISLGSKTSANSFPVVIASDQAAIPIQHGNLVDASNSSTATLTANSVFTGTGTSSLNYSALAVEVYADQASAANGLAIQQSQDNSNWDTSDTFTISASTAFNTVVNLIGQYYRVKYTNGGTNQGTFRLQTIKMVADAVLPRTLTAAGSLRVDGSSVTQPVSGTITANAGTGSFTVAQATAANLNAQVVGSVASAGANAGNPVKIGAVYNTTQPTVTTGQIVDAQATARGARIVATGADTFNVSVNAALPTGANTIGAVTQASGPWTSNITQINGAAVSNTNAFVSEMNTQQWARSGNVFVSTTDRVLTSSAVTVGACIWFNAIGKNVLITSIVVGLNNNTLAGDFSKVTTNPALGSNLTTTNMNLGSGTTSSVTAATYTVTTTTTAGTVIGAFTTPNPGQAEIVSSTPGRILYIPSGTAAGVAVWPTLGAAGYWFCTFTWVEF